MSANVTTLKKVHAQLGVSTDKLASMAGSGSAANIPSATTTVAGTVLKAAADADSVAADVATIVADHNDLLAKLRAAGILAV